MIRREVGHQEGERRVVIQEVDPVASRITCGVASRLSLNRRWIPNLSIGIGTGVDGKS